MTPTAAVIHLREPSTNTATIIVFTAATTNEIPYTPAKLAITGEVTALFTWVVPNKSQGNPVMRERATSTATHRKGAASRARLTLRLAMRTSNAPNNP